MTRVWPITGRDIELDRIRNAIAMRRSVVLSGPAGIGKTRLAREVMREAHAEQRPVWAALATHSARDIPFGALAALALRSLASPSASAKVILDELAALGRETPHALVVDDAHNLDRQSAALVLQAAMTAVVPLVVTIRDDEPAPDAVTALRGDEATLVRTGNHVRVTLGERWFDTGVGERLGVVFTDPPSVPGHRFTEIARDPLRLSGPLDADLVAAGGVSLLHPSADVAGAGAERIELAAAVRVLDFPVYRQEGQWVSDVSLPGVREAGFVRLMLARYQPESVERRHLSVLTETDWMPIYGERTLHVARDGDALVVTLSDAQGDAFAGTLQESMVRAFFEQGTGVQPSSLSTVGAAAPGAWSGAGAEAVGSLNAPLRVVLPASPPEALRLVVTEEDTSAPSASAGGHPEFLRRTTFIAQLPIE